VADGRRTSALCASSPTSTNCCRSCCATVARGQ